jgi:Mn-dependent DtxR family transcriptional regulator
MAKKNTVTTITTGEHYLLVFVSIALADRAVTNRELVDMLCIKLQDIRNKTSRLRRAGYLIDEEVPTKKGFGSECGYRLTEKGKLQYNLISNFFVTLLN